MKKTIFNRHNGQKKRTEDLVAIALVLLFIRSLLW